MRVLGGRLRAPAGWTGIATLLVATTSAVVIGLIPDLIRATLGTGLRALLWTILALAVVGVAAKLFLVRPRELGIVLDLDPGDQREWDGHPAQVAHAQAQAQQDRAPAPIRERLSVDPVRRNEQLKSVFRQLNKASGNQTQAVSLYPSVTVHDSFAIGRLVRAGSFPMTLMQKPEALDDAGQFYPAIGLGAHLRSPLTHADRQRAEAFLRADPVDLNPHADADRLALVVVLSARSVLIRPSAVKAAAAGRSDDYAMGPNDRCRAALVIETIDGSVPADRNSFELTVRYAYERWTAWLDEQQSGTGEQILFLAGPNTIAMALGYVFGRQRMRLIPHTRTS